MIDAGAVNSVRDHLWRRQLSVENDVHLQANGSSSETSVFWP